MPIPLWAVGLALQAASVYARNRAQNKIEDRQGDIAAAERVREAGRQKERDESLDTLLAGFEEPAQRAALGEAAAKRGQRYDENTAPGSVPGEFVAGTTAPQEVKTEIASRVADYLRQGREDVKRRAKLGALADVQFGNNVAIGRAGQELDTLGDFTRGSQGVVGFEMEGAKGAGDRWNQFGDLLGTAGTLMGLYSMTQPAVAAEQAAAPIESRAVTTRAAAPNYYGDDIWMHRNTTAPFYRR